MSDRIGSLLSGLGAQLPPAPFAPAEAVRRRGRQRARRRVALAGVALAAVAGTGTSVLLGGTPLPGLVFPPVSQPVSPPVSPPVVTPSDPVPPAPDRVPARWSLAAEDLGPGDWRRDEFRPEWTEGPDRWLWESVCPGYRSEDYPTLGQRLDQRTVFWSDGPWNMADPPPWVHEIVDLLRPGAGPDHLADIRAVLALCPDGADARYRVTASGFAGDESMMVRGALFPAGGGAPVVNYTAVVRVGDAVATLRGYRIDTTDDDAVLRELAQRAADHLR
jgi:hypothetical protein